MTRGFRIGRDLSPERTRRERTKRHFDGDADALFGRGGDTASTDWSSITSHSVGLKVGRGLRSAPHSEHNEIRHCIANAARRGVHIYETTGAVLSANASWVMVHARKAGKYEVKLPQACRKVTDVVTERVVGENASSVTLDLEAKRTAVLLLDK